MTEATTIEEPAPGAPITARKVPYSTIVGQSITLHDAKGIVTATLSIRNVERVRAEAIAQWLCGLVNTDDAATKALDCHGDLVAALRNILALLKPWRPAANPDLEAALVAAEAALAKAEA